MQKYRLMWQGDGCLDLSQILDERGIPITLTTKGATAIVNSVTFQHALIQHYLKHGLYAKKLDEPKPTEEIVIKKINLQDPLLITQIPIQIESQKSSDQPKQEISTPTPTKEYRRTKGRTIHNK